MTKEEDEIIEKGIKAYLFTQVYEYSEEFIIPFEQIVYVTNSYKQKNYYNYYYKKYYNKIQSFL